MIRSRVTRVFMGAPEFDLSDLAAVLFCPSCGAGYRAGPTRCTECNKSLVPRSSVEAGLSLDGEPGGSSPITPDEDAPEGSEKQGPEFDLADPDALGFCPLCGSGYRAGVSHCADCGQELVPRSWVEADLQRRSASPAGARDSTSTVLLADIANPFKAELLSAALLESGIWFIAQPMSYWEIKGWGAVRFLVEPQDLERAQQVVRDLDELDVTSPEVEP